MTAHPALPAYGALALTSLFWSGNTIAGRALHEEIGPAALAFWRWLLVLGVLAPFVAGELRRAWPDLRRDWRYVATLGLMSTGLYHALIFWVVKYTTAINAQLINTTIPLWVMLVGWIGLRIRPTGREVLGLIACSAGVVAILTHGEWSRLAALELNAGDLMMLGGMVVWAIYTHLLARRPLPLTGLGHVFATGSFGLAALVPLYALETAVAGGFEPTAPVVAGIAYTALLASVASTVLFNYGLARVGPTITSLFTHLIPVFGAALSWLLLGEGLGVHHLAGFALILAGLAVAQGALPGRSRAAR